MSDFSKKAVKKLTQWLSCCKDNMERNKVAAEMHKSLAKLPKKTPLTDEQKREIQRYYRKMLHMEVPTVWHEYFYSRTGIFSPKYIPSSIYKTNIIGRLNIYPLKRAYTDKNITDLILPTANQPKIFMKNMNGYYYVEGKPVTKDDAAELCKDLGEVILKPSLTARGQGVQKLKLKDGVNVINGQRLIDIFTEYKEDYLIEELVVQHERMAQLNPSSVNTIRIVTYRSGMDIKVVYTVVRIGRLNQTIDNESAGGISAAINPDGKIAKYAYGKPGVDKVEYTDNGTKLDGYEVPSYQEALDMVKELHYQLPYFNIMAWDIAITKDGKPLMIEFNMTPDLSQSANGPAFGELTDEILTEAMKHKNTWSRLGQEAMWKRH